MFGLTDIDIQFLSDSPALVVLALAVLLALSYLLYRTTNPPLPWWVRLGLWFLRLVAVLALILALAQPVITYTRDYERARRLSVLIDGSASMDREEAGKSRLQRVDSLLATEAMEQWRALGEVSRYYFGANLGGERDEIDREASALGQALRQLDRREMGQPADHWLVLSDGRSNAGVEPSEAAAGLQVPVTTVAMAMGGGETDIGLADVDFNPVVYSGQPTEVKVRLSWQSAIDRTVAVQLSDSGQVLAEETMVIDQDDGFADLSLRYTPGRPGQRLLQIRLPVAENEANPDNNQKTISVKTLKGRMAVLLVTMAPDYEVGFLNRFLRQADRYEVDLVVLGRNSGNMGGRFPTGQTELNRYDLVVLDDPDPNFIQAQQGLLRSYLADRGGGLWVQFGARMAAGSERGALAQLLPFHPESSVQPLYRQVHAIPVEGQLFHPAVRLGDTRSEIRAAWAELPPFRMIIPSANVASETVMLARVAGVIGADGQPAPALGYRRIGPGKVLASAVQPFWAWGFETLAYGGRPVEYGRFLDGVIRWLTVTDDFDPIRIEPDREVYSRGETVRFNGFAFDQGYRPLENVTGSVSLTRNSDGEQFEADLLATGEGEFEAEFSNLPPGEYRYRGVMSREDRQLKESTGNLVVESFTLEQYDQSGDPTTLAAIARSTGGRQVSFASFDQALEQIDPSPVKLSENREVALWGRLWLLLIFIGALAIEWILRKVNQLL